MGNTGKLRIIFHDDLVMSVKGFFYSTVELEFGAVT